MNKELASIREDFKKGKLDKKHVDQDPLVQFTTWMKNALDASLVEPTSMILSTIDDEGQPHSRTVLLKGVEEGGFLFYTNYESKKGRQLSSNPRAALTFFWKELQRQVNISGSVEKVSEQLSDEYFQSRPRKSRLGAWASYQSQELDSREELMARFAKLTLKYAGREVPRPPHWGGFKLIPHRIEFWQGRESRLHDRIEYLLEGEQWSIKRLSP